MIFASMFRIDGFGGTAHVAQVSEIAATCPQERAFRAHSRAFCATESLLHDVLGVRHVRDW